MKMKRKKKDKKKETKEMPHLFTSFDLSSRHLARKLDAADLEKKITGFLIISLACLKERFAKYLK